MPETKALDPTYFADLVNALQVQRAMLADATSSKLDKLERTLRDAGEAEAEQLVLELKAAEARLGYALGSLAVKYGSRMFPRGEGGDGV